MSMSLIFVENILINKKTKQNKARKMKIDYSLSTTQINGTFYIHSMMEDTSQTTKKNVVMKKESKIRTKANTIKCI